MNFKKGSPESAGIPSGCLLHFLDRLQKKQVPMHSFLLMRHDTLIAEGYYAPYQKDTLLACFRSVKVLHPLRSVFWKRKENYHWMIRSSHIFQTRFQQMYIRGLQP